MLSQEFPLLTVLCVKRVFGENSQCLFPTYMALHALYRTLDLNAPHKDVKKTKTKVDSRFSPENLQQTIASEADADKKAALEELLGARDVIELERVEEEEAKRLQELEEANLREATSTGAMGVCGCCFDDIPLNRMVHCDGDEMHYFCRSCARRNVETVIGLSKYEFSCMSTDACEAGFSMEQRLLFLDKKTLKKLERLEREANLRQAGIENLASCPFCDFAAEYPPVEVNKVFTCENPECGVVSCRLCKEEAHIPKTCEEMKKEDNGEEARKTIEEAMSSAMIRKCNKCKLWDADRVGPPSVNWTAGSAPFIKEAGCNKMTCTRCMNVQCYICHKSCDYTHFNDPSRGGKEGNCALFDDVKKRHNDEVTAAEERTRRELIEKNPEMAKILLKNGEGSKDAAAAAPAAPAAAAQPAAPAGGARNIFGRPFARAPRANANQQHPLNAPAQAGAGAAAAPNGGPAPPPVAGAADAAVQGPNNPAAQPAAMAPNQRGLRAAVEPIGNRW